MNQLYWRRIMYDTKTIKKVCLKYLFDTPIQNGGLESGSQLKIMVAKIMFFEFLKFFL